MTDLFRTRYRVIHDWNAGYAVQQRPWWLPFYMPVNYISYKTLREAMEAIELAKRKPVYKN